MFNRPIKITLNPSGDNGAVFFIDDRDYNLTISFDYLFSLKCETILNKLNEPYNINNLNCNTPLNIFEGLDVSLNLDIITSANTTETVYSSNFPYLVMETYMNILQLMLIVVLCLW
jgi:hypothetical protein